jgi:hypothetical protein
MHVLGIHNDNYTIFKSVFFCFLIAIFTVINGTFREVVMASYFGQQIALSLSSLSLSIIFFATSHTSYNFYKITAPVKAKLIGLQWMLMTLIFEFIFGFDIAHALIDKIL